MDRKNNENKTQISSEDLKAVSGGDMMKMFVNLPRRPWEKKIQKPEIPQEGGATGGW